nr:MAG TPA: hypothetical protein [Caudoviricetes sp.]
MFVSCFVVSTFVVSTFEESAVPAGLPLPLQDVKEIAAQATATNNNFFIFFAF